MEEMRKKITKGSQRRELSDKEMAWRDEVKILAQKVLGEGEVEDLEDSQSSMVKVNKEPWQRYEEVRELKDGILESVEEILGGAEEEGEGKGKEKETREDSRGENGDKVGGDLKVPSEVRKKKVAQIMGLLERESALVEGAKTRLERLALI